MSIDNLTGVAQFRVSEWLSDQKILSDSFFSQLDEVDTQIPGSLVYCQNLHYLQMANQNPHVSAIILPNSIVSELSKRPIAQIVSPNPRMTFFELYLRMSTEGLIQSRIDYGIGQNCRIHPSASISKKARVGNRVEIAANAIINDDVQVADDVYIGPNVVIGAEGLITLRRENGALLFVKHAGGVEIEDGCQILAGAVIAKSLFRSFTRIGRHSQIGIMANIGHGASIGNETVISGNSVVAGRVKLGNKVWVGASASIAQGLRIGDGAQIKMGSVVISDVLNNQTVSGNFAIPHKTNMLNHLKLGKT